MTDLMKRYWFKRREKEKNTVISSIPCMCLDNTDSSASGIYEVVSCVF